MNLARSTSTLFSSLHTLMFLIIPPKTPWATSCVNRSQPQNLDTFIYTERERERERERRGGGGGPEKINKLQPVNSSDLEIS